MTLRSAMASEIKPSVYVSTKIATAWNEKYSHVSVSKMPPARNKVERGEFGLFQEKEQEETFGGVRESRASVRRVVLPRRRPGRAVPTIEKAHSRRP